MPKELQLDEPSWENLGDQLLSEYKALTANLDQTFYNRKLIILVPDTRDIQDVEMEETPSEDPKPSKEELASRTEVTPPATIKLADELTPLESAVTTTAVATTTTITDSGEAMEKEASEAEQAALKRKRKEMEERSGLR